MAKLTLHHLDQSRSHRILWLLEELGVDYEMKTYLRDPETFRAPDTLKAVHPLGKSPVITTESGDVLAESGAMIEELVETYGPELRPEPGTKEFRRYRYFLHYGEGSLMPPLLVKLIFIKLREAPVPFFLKPIPNAIANKVDATFTDPEIKKQFDFLEAEIGSGPYFLGEKITGVDFQLSYPIGAAANRLGGLSDYPNLAAFLKRIEARPAFQKAVKLGGPPFAT